MHGHSKAIPAAELYAGDHWSVVRRLPDVARSRGLRPTLWVISAGYGLVPASALLRSYSATFAPRHPDSVEGDRREWWTELARLKLSDQSAPRSIVDLVCRDPSASVIVVASAHYVEAIEDDLKYAASRLLKRERLTIITTPGRMSRGPLGSHVVAAHAQWQATLGGARTSIHARLAERILQAADDLNVNSIRARLQQMMERSPAVPHDERQRMTDDDVRAFIRQALTHDLGAGHTKLLRALRDTGRACEQSRFRRIFFEVRRHDDK